MIRVLVADDHPFLRKGLRASLEEHPSIRVVGEASNGTQTLTLVERVPFDVLILDISLPDMSGIDVLKQLVHLHPGILVVILSAFPERQYAIRCINAGAMAYVTKDSAPAELASALTRVAMGKRYVSEQLAGQLADTLAGYPEPQLHDQLSDREYQVLLLLADGLSVQAIAEKLSISTPSVYTYRSRIIFKTGLKSTAEMVRYVVENGLHP